MIRMLFGTGLASSIRDVIFRKRTRDGYTLSSRIWNLAEFSQREILHRVYGAMANGTSAVELSRNVSEFLLQPGPAWTTGITRSVTGRGSLAYNALRLARTEINQGYRQAHILLANRSPLVEGVRWNLSNSHPDYSNQPWYEYMGYPEICDYRAEHDHSGKGPGVFSKDAVPDDHPNGLCYLTDVFVEPRQIAETLRAA